MTTGSRRAVLGQQVLLFSHLRTLAENRLVRINAIMDNERHHVTNKAKQPPGHAQTQYPGSANILATTVKPTEC